MIKRLKYIAAFLTSLNNCFAATTAYINGPDEDYGSLTTIRKDVVIIGSGGGDFANMTTPSGQVNSITKIWRLAIVDSSAGSPLPNTNPTNPSTYPNTLTALWVIGDVKSIDTCIGATRANALPTPVTNAGGASIPVNIHFLLKTAPTSLPIAWFTQAVPDHSRIIIEPGSADPGIDSILSDITTNGLTNTSLLIGAPVTLQATTTTVTPAVQRHPKVLPIHAHQSSGIKKSQLILNASTIFSSAVHGISLLVGTSPTAPITVDFTNTSSIIDVDATQNGSGGMFGIFTIEAGKTVTMLGINHTIPTATYYLKTTGSLTNVTKIINVTATYDTITDTLNSIAPRSSIAIPALPITATTAPVISWVH